jgi:Tfp pilus assembly protein PilF
MARFDKSSPKGTKPNAAVAAPRKSADKGSSYEDTMFFPRLRRHAKWMFVFLALVFGLGFVGFGTGAGGVGVGDLFKGSGGSGSQSVSDAREKAEENPKSAEAWHELSTALQTDGQTDEAVGALQTAVSIDKKDPNLFRELGGLYLAQAGAKSQEAQLAQLEAAYTAPDQHFPGQLFANDQPVFNNPLGSAINAAVGVRIQQAQAGAQVAATGAVDAFKTVAKLLPNDPNAQLELATTAQQTGDTAAQIAAYKRFLVLAPDDASVPIVKQQLKQLQSAAGSVSG